VKSPVREASYVGIDLSLTSTGFCYKCGTELAMKTIKTTPKTAENDLERLRYIRKQVMGSIPFNTVMVCIEDFFVPHRPGQINAAKGLIMAGTLVRIAMLEHGLPFYVISPGQLKKFATGKGNGPKGLVIREIYKRWGVNAKDDNQADACVLAHIAETIDQLRRGADVELPKYQQDTITKVREERPRYNVESG